MYNELSGRFEKEQKINAMLREDIANLQGVISNMEKDKAQKMIEVAITQGATESLKELLGLVSTYPV